MQQPILRFKKTCVKLITNSKKTIQFSSHKQKDMYPDNRRDDGDSKTAATHERGSGTFSGIGRPGNNKTASMYAKPVK